MLSEDFWHWFSATANQLAAAPEDAKLLNELDERVLQAWPHLAWEIGPDPAGGWYFALSPNLNRQLADDARNAIDAAPNIEGWKLYAARQRKEWDGRFELQTKQGIRQVNCADWQFLLLRYPNGEQELVLIAAEAESLDEDERWHAAAIVLEGLLGEDCLLTHVKYFTLESALDAKLIPQVRPIHQLPSVFSC